MSGKGDKVDQATGKRNKYLKFFRLDRLFLLCLTKI